MDLAARIAAHLDARLRQRRRLLVAVDGPDAAGKTTLADAIAAALPDRTVRASVDGFHRPAAERRARGALSPEGYYADSFDLPGLAHLLRRFASGAADVTTALFDHRADAPCVVTVEAPRQAALVVDGVFLLRPELRPHWDLCVYLHVADDVILARALRRDLGLFGDADTLRLHYAVRYLPAQARYRASHDPVGQAQLVVDTNDPVRPGILRDTLGIASDPAG